MKKYLVLTIAILLLCNTANAQWFWQNPLPQGHLLKSVKFVSSNIGWAVGESGALIKTTNGGETWLVQPTGINNTLSSVDFADENNGIVVGTFGIILRTTNGGISWTDHSIARENMLYSVSFPNKKIA